jgi:hypothetical protein
MALLMPLALSAPASDMHCMPWTDEALGKTIEILVQGGIIYVDTNDGFRGSWFN